MNKHNFLIAILGASLILFVGLFNILLMFFFLPLILFFLTLAIIRNEEHTKIGKFKEINKRLDTHDQNYKVLTDLLHAMREDFRKFSAGKGDADQFSSLSDLHSSVNENSAPSLLSQNIPAETKREEKTESDSKS